MRYLVPFATGCLFLLPSARVHAQANAGPDASICESSYMLQGSLVPGGAVGNWTMVSGCGTFEDPTVPNTLVTALCLGTNILEWTVTDIGGTSSDLVAITVFEGGWPANAGPDQTIIGPLSSAQLAGTACAFPCTCTWSIVAGTGTITDMNDPNAMITGLTQGANTLQWTCGQGPCWTSDQVVISFTLSTGLQEAAASGHNAFRFDPQTLSLAFVGTGTLEGLRLVDAQGRTMDLPASGSDRSWDMTHYPAGMYVVQAMVDGSVRTQRFVVSH